MCGFLGQFSLNKIEEEIMHKSNSYLICRGPDDLQKVNGKISNIFSSTSKSNFYFIFNRLRILDFTEFSTQPMFSSQFNTAVMFNGEIYNHHELRKNLELEGVKFYSDHSDSEVVLNGFSFYGISFAEKLVGQFAIAYFNGSNNELSLIRDRLGQKPLFYTHNKELVTFGSNLKSLVKLKKNYQVDEYSFFEYLNYGVVTSPKTIFKDIYKVEPAQIITFNLNTNYTIKNKKKYWIPEEYIDNNKFNQEKFIEFFSNSVKSRENADVKIATFLSGGIDSTSIIKNLHDRGTNINSFSANYQDKKYDESKWSDLVSKKYSDLHYSNKITKDELSKSIIKSINIFDEPYSDPSTLPSYLLSKAISENYKVAISGDGGDELMGGYVRTSFLMNPSRKNLNFLSLIDKIYPNFLGTGNKFKRYSSDLSYALESYFADPNLLKLLNVDYQTNFKNKFFSDTGDDYKSLMLTEYKFYLSEMMMLKIDRTSMANSLEIRSPFVDHRLVEYILSVSSKYYNYKNPKAELKNYLSSDFDSYFINRKKMGFVFNVENWIFNNLNLVEDTILSNVPNVSKSQIKKLTLNKSRINGIRIWKLFFIGNYLASLDNSR